MPNRSHGGTRWRTCPLRRISTRRSTRQDAQINYLSTLSIFMKQTTYLATLPNPNLKANGMSLLLKVVAEVIAPVMASLSSARRTRFGDSEVRNPQFHTREALSILPLMRFPILHLGPIPGSCGIASFLRCHATVARRCEWPGSRRHSPRCPWAWLA
jgi:hypothetical protein